MIFAKMDYLNNIPLNYFLKSSSLPSYVKKTLDYKKDVPAKLNKALERRKIDAAIISSIKSSHKKYKNLNIGICANKKVLSVLVDTKEQSSLDIESATSNALAKVLKQKGKVIMGDKALKYYLDSENKEHLVDLCQEWYKKTSLPFMFARFSYTKCNKKTLSLLKLFIKKNTFKNQRVKIPNYILDYYSKSRKIHKKDIKKYLELIYYKIGKKELKAFRLYEKYNKYYS
ncbi:MqnA/MqnD/SBP family protein [Campylobacter canadensis]|uniref:Chorismate dehydratase n=1 Tax=Campylobacter canadensis TaxID=449520 RepID=A0ABS7WRK5_9BACT|nr:MqnA/MqnD/SBP family protein [Campylobacter canadensis]MBZ7986967.1 menaquinone via futalosine step 1 [Campylobacter canadensis]MBZ7994286.1 menaquinone via futalosine step 1 [Campylobacter canadensis]MBZ7995722.1 menaquinone via futalosine step 1 [Campylobacter canadensis]MBZ7998003.1 menaquinone via futalosine step 1 [Campylobacter canadensis]MBZ7999618.1 menaquinone via futalosine step 1 [Campylobacter canadensis]